MSTQKHITPGYIEQDELISLLDKNPLDVIIVDVRDEDYENGRLPRSIHYPSDTFLLNLNDLITEIANMKPIPTHIVFHCYLSQRRGPKSAKYFLELSSSRLPHCVVSILKGGWEEWYIRFHGDQSKVKPIENKDE
ncbi:putative Cdc25 family phosphatase [Monocercomonoides exilis]|uniref:putative Cdc25 family phosphatase n=1 Tax=Monocercomonoides exilis TaxID=2049356 RepID=UPI00355A8852|nr:putative Cdc25 family phosphatase [Monocercomonoides exilis]